MERYLLPPGQGCWPLFMAGMAGFEPADAGVKVPCLTTWRHPNIFPTTAGKMAAVGDEA